MLSNVFPLAVHAVVGPFKTLSFFVPFFPFSERLEITIGELKIEGEVRDNMYGALWSQSSTFSACCRFFVLQNRTKKSDKKTPSFKHVLAQKRI